MCISYYHHVLPLWYYKIPTISTYSLLNEAGCLDSVGGELVSEKEIYEEYLECYVDEVEALAEQQMQSPDVVAAESFYEVVGQLGLVIFPFTLIQDKKVEACHNFFHLNKIPVIVWWLILLFWVPELLRTSQEFIKQ